MSVVILLPSPHGTLYQFEQYYTAGNHAVVISLPKIWRAFDLFSFVSSCFLESISLFQEFVNWVISYISAHIDWSQKNVFRFFLLLGPHGTFYQLEKFTV